MNFIEEAISDDGYEEFGKYFAVDVQNGNQRFLISNVGRTNGGQGAYVEVGSICTHGQVYQSASKLCSSVSSGEITIGLQDTSATSCDNNNDGIKYDRLVGESLCDYGCSSTKFGKYCQRCSTYMTRIGETTPSGYQWDDNTSNE